MLTCHPGRQLLPLSWVHLRWHSQKMEQAGEGMRSKCMDTLSAILERSKVNKNIRFSFVVCLNYSCKNLSCLGLWRLIGSQSTCISSSIQLAIPVSWCSPFCPDPTADILRKIDTRLHYVTKQANILLLFQPLLGCITLFQIVHKDYSSFTVVFKASTDLPCQKVHMQWHLWWFCSKKALSLFVHLK